MQMTDGLLQGHPFRFAKPHSSETAHPQPTYTKTLIIVQCWAYGKRDAMAIHRLQQRTALHRIYERTLESTSREGLEAGDPLSIKRN